jgi:hypothetical protein
MPGGTENLNQETQCPYRVSNQGHPDYKLEALLFTQEVIIVLLDFNQNWNVLSDISENPQHHIS